MKSLIPIVLGVLLVANSAFAIGRPASARAPECREVRPVAQSPAHCEEPRARPIGLDLRRVPEHLRYLVLWAWMASHGAVMPR